MCPLFCGHARWVGTGDGTSCHAACSTITTTSITKSYVSVPATATQKVKPDLGTMCIGLDCGIIFEICVCFGLFQGVQHGGGPHQGKFVNVFVLGSHGFDLFTHVRGFGQGISQSGWKHWRVDGQDAGISHYPMFGFNQLRSGC